MAGYAPTLANVGLNTPLTPDEMHALILSGGGIRPGRNAPGFDALSQIASAGAEGWNAPAPLDEAYRDYGGPLTSPLIGGYDVARRTISALANAGRETGEQIGKAAGSDPLGHDVAALLSGEYPGAEIPGLTPHPYEERPIPAPGATKAMPLGEEGVQMFAARRPPGGPRPPRGPRPPGPTPTEPPVEPPPAEPAPDFQAAAKEAIERHQMGGEPVPDIPTSPSGRRASITSTSLRDMPLDQAIQHALSGQHLIQNERTGQFVGAPRGFTTMDQILAQRDRFDNAAKMGVMGRNWYDNSQAANYELTGGVAPRQRLLASEQAFWSPRANPETNYGFALQAHNAYEVGRPLDIVYTGRQGRAYAAARDIGQLPKQGPKTLPFMGHLDPTSEDPTTGVNDIWHARANGFTNPGGKPFDRALTPQEHAYLDAETVLAVKRANEERWGGFDDWTPGRVQAAGWVGKKIETELAANLAKKMPYEQAYAKAVEDSRADFSDVMDKYTMYGTHEAIPGAGIGHLPSIVSGPRALREAYSLDPRSQWNTAPGGRDILYENLGFYSRPTVQAQGSFTPAGTGATEINPAFAARPQVDYVPGPGGGLRLSPASEHGVNAVEALRAYMDAQNMGAAHKFIAERGYADAQNSIGIEHPRALTPDEMNDLSAAVKPYNLSPSDTGRGVTLMNFGDGPKGTEIPKLLKGDLGNTIKRILPEAGDMKRGELLPLSTDYEKSLQTPGQGLATRQLFEALNRPEIPAAAGKLDTPALRQKAVDRLQRDIEYAKQTGDPTRIDIQNARRVVGKTGLAGLADLLAKGPSAWPKGGLPALVTGTGLGLGMARAGLNHRKQQQY